MTPFDLITNEMKIKQGQGKPILIFIAGEQRSRKTVLAKELSTIDPAFEYIDAYNTDIASLITDNTRTYIIDHSACCQIPSFFQALNTHLDNGGAAILIVQSQNDLNLNYYREGSWFTLQEDGLKQIINPNSCRKSQEIFEAKIKPKNNGVAHYAAPKRKKNMRYGKNNRMIYGLDNPRDNWLSKQLDQIVDAGDRHIDGLSIKPLGVDDRTLELIVEIHGRLTPKQLRMLADAIENVPKD